MQFESLRMSDDEDIEKLFLQVCETVKVMRGLDETINESTISQKVLISLPATFNPKLSAIEEISNIKTLTINEFIGSLIAYEMRITKGKSNTTEENNKSTEVLECSYSDSDEEEEKFLSRLKKGTNECKNNLHFKCLNCGRVGHYASKCPFTKE